MGQKHKDITRVLQQYGYYVKRHGKKHMIYTNGIQDIAVPRHHLRVRTYKRILTEIRNEKNKVGSKDDIQGSYTD